MIPTHLKSTLIIGRGEVGNSLYNVLSPVYPTWCDDIRPHLRLMKDQPASFDVIHVCTRHGADFIANVKAWVKKYKPRIVNICTTVPVETMDELEAIGSIFCHSTTRGLHPNLSESIRVIPKHIGGRMAVPLSIYFNGAGVPTRTHERARTTALLHILNNVHYGVNLVFADEAAQLCRQYNVDYFDYMTYTQTNNIGYQQLGHSTKVRPILTPPSGKIGGHCITHSAALIPEENRPEIFNIVASYNED